MTKTRGIAPSKLVSEWADLYSRRLYNLAFFEAESATEREPDNALHWFLLGETALARNRPDRAKEAFAKAVEVLEGMGGGAVPERLRKNLGQAARRLQAVLEENPLLPAPAEPFRWIESPDSIEEGASFGAAPSVADKQAVMVHEPGSLVEKVDIFDAEARPAIVEERPEMMDAPKAGGKTEERPAVREEKVPVREEKAEPESTAEQPREPAGEAPAEPVEDPWGIWERDLLHLLSHGQYTEAKKMADGAVQRYPENTWLREMRAKVLGQLGDKEGAARDLVEAFRGLVEGGEQREGIKVAREAMALARGNGNVILTLAGLAAGAGMMALASDAYSLGVETERRSGNQARLKQALEKAVEVFPGNQNWRQELQRMALGQTRAGKKQPPRLEDTPQRSGYTPPPRLTGWDRERGSAQAMPARQEKPASATNAGAVEAVTLLGGLTGAFLSFVFMLVGFGLVGWICFLIMKGAENASDFPAGSKAESILGTMKVIVLVIAIIGSLRAPFPF